MKNKTTIFTFGAALAVALAASVPTHADEVINGETFTSASVSSTYLFRGLDLGGVSVAGNAGWIHSTGLYVGAGVITGDLVNGTKQDYVVGVNRDVSDYNFDLSFARYTYPSWDDSNGVNPVYSEAQLTISRDFASFGMVDNRDNESRYYSLDLKGEKIGVVAGIQTNENEYKHVQLDYMPTENLTFSVSRAFDNDKDDNFEVEKDVRLVATYSLPL